MLRKSGQVRTEDHLSAEEEIKDPFVLEFLGLKDEYSETELGGDFAFVACQRRLRVGDEWYRVDLLFFHRKLRCLVVIDLKLGKFTHADAGQMHLYLNYAREHWTNEHENPPVGLILYAQKDDAVAHYALEGLPNKVVAREYLAALPEGGNTYGRNREDAETTGDAPSAETLSALAELAADFKSRYELSFADALARKAKLNSSRATGSSRRWKRVMTLSTVGYAARKRERMAKPRASRSPQYKIRDCASHGASLSRAAASPPPKTPIDLGSGDIQTNRFRESHSA